jgi:hypothetical protein
MHAGEPVVEARPPPPALPPALANNILPVAYNRANFMDPDSAGLPPTLVQVEAAARRADPNSTGMFDEDLRQWAAYLEARDAYRLRARDARADAAAAAAAGEVAARAEVERLAREKKFLSDYNSNTMEGIRERALMGAERGITMHNWQANAASTLTQYMVAGYKDVSAKVASEPGVCSGNTDHCRRACGIYGAPCTCTTEDRFINHFHTSKARVGRVWVTQGGGKTMVECLLPLLMGYKERMAACPPELKTRDITIISAPETVLINQMRAEGLGVVDPEVLKGSAMYKNTGLSLDVLAAYNSRVHFLTESTKDIDWPTLRDTKNVIVGNIQKWGKLMGAQAGKPEAERIQWEDVSTLIGDESHLGTGWMDTPWDKCEANASWGWLIQRCNKSWVFKFSGSLKEAESDLPIVIECKACELIDKGLLCQPVLNVWGFEGMVRASDESPYVKDQLDEEDARELRTGPHNFRIAAIDIAKVMAADRKGIGEFASGLPVSQMTRVQGKQTYDGASKDPTFVAAHMNAAYAALPICDLTGRKMRAAALHGDMSAEQEQDVVNRSRFAFSIDNLVVENKLTLGFSDSSKKHILNLRKVTDDKESQEAHKQLFGRGNRVNIYPDYDPADQLFGEGKSALKQQLRVAALGHVGCGQCKNYGENLTNKAYKRLYDKCVALAGSPDGLCDLCKPRVDRRAQVYFARLKDIGGKEPMPNGEGGNKIKTQYFHIHELEIFTIMGSKVLESIHKWAEDNGCQHYIRTVNRELLEGLRAEEWRAIANIAPIARHHQAQIAQQEADKLAAKAAEAQAAARLAVEQTFEDMEREEQRLVTEMDAAAERAEHELSDDSMSDDDEEEVTASQRGSGDEAMGDDSDSESVANEAHAMGDIESEAEDEGDNAFDPSSEQEGEAGAEPGERRPSRRAARVAQRRIEFEAARQARIEEDARLREAQAVADADRVAAVALAAMQQSRDADAEAIAAEELAAAVTDEEAQQRLAERRRQLEEDEAARAAAAEARRQELAEQRAEAERQEAEHRERLAEAERARVEAARLVTERMQAVNQCVPSLALLQDGDGAVSIEFTMDSVPAVGTLLLLAATKHVEDFGSSSTMQPFSSTKWKIVTELAPVVTAADGDRVVRSIPDHLLDHRNAQTGDRGAFCILALPDGHTRVNPEKATFADITYKTPRFPIKIGALKQAIADREAAQAAAAAATGPEEPGVAPMEVEGEEVEAPPNPPPSPEAVAAVVLVPNSPEAEARAPSPVQAAVAPVIAAPVAQEAPVLSVRQVARGRPWEHVTAAERPADAGPERGIPETRRAQTVKSYAFGTEQTVQYRDALLAPTVLDLAEADEDQRLRDNTHPRHMARAWASRHGIGERYYNILESFIALLRSGTPEAAEFKKALEGVRHYSERYHCDAARAWTPPAANARARRAAPSPDAPVFMTAEAVLRLYQPGWTLIEEAFARLERHQQQTGGFGNIQLPDVVPGVRHKLPRKISQLDVKDHNGGLVFVERTVAQMPRLVPPAAAQGGAVVAVALNTHFGRISPAQKRSVFERFPGEIDARMLTQFEEDMKFDIVNPAGGAPLPAVGPATAGNYALALVRALFHCMEISRTALEGSPWKIPPGMTAGELMRERIPHMEEPANVNGAGAFYTFLTTNPTLRQPFICPAAGNNQSSCHDWKQAFVHWNALYLEQRNFALNRA